MNGLHKQMVRLAFTVYWPGGSPSTEVFYLSGHFLPTITNIGNLEREIVSLLQVNENTNPLAAVFINGMIVETSPDEITALTWRVLGNWIAPAVEA